MLTQSKLPLHTCEKNLFSFSGSGSGTGDQHMMSFSTNQFDFGWFLDWFIHTIFRQFIITQPAWSISKSRRVLVIDKQRLKDYDISYKIQ